MAASSVWIGCLQGVVEGVKLLRRLWIGIPYIRLESKCLSTLLNPLLFDATLCIVKILSCIIDLYNMIKGWFI